ncbi:MAG: hypothetical protein AB1568_13980 [Thermodesulfobacteriota bacterium]
MPRYPMLLLFFLLLPFEPGYAAEGEVARTLTVYDADFALVRETRLLRLEAGENPVVLDDLPDSIEADSLLLIPADGQVRLTELAYTPPSLSRERLAAGFIGREIAVGRGDDGALEKAVLLGMDGGEPLLGMDGGVLAGFTGRMFFPGAPGELSGRGRLTARLVSPAAGRSEITLQYLARAIGWNGRYVGMLEGDRLHLAGRFVLDNRSSLAGEIAGLSFVAGEILRPQPSPPMPMMEAQVRMLAAGDAVMAAEPVGGHHLYRHAGRARLLAGTSLMLPFLDSSDIPVSRRYTVRSAIGGGRSDASTDLAVEMAVVFRNAEGGPGQPLPAGTLQLYGRASDGGPVLLGENRLPHTPVGGDVRLVFGKAFDLLARRVDVDYRRIDKRTTESAFRIELENHSLAPETVAVEVQLPGDWQIVEESAAHARKSADVAAWQVALPAGAATAISARVRYLY